MAGEILNAQISGGSGLATILSTGLGGTHSVVKTETGTHTVLAAHGTKDRAVLVVVYIDEVFATGTVSQTVIEVGEDDTIDKCFNHTVLVDAAAGTVRCFAFQNTATKKVIITSTAAAGTGTGGVTVTVLGIPTS